MLWFLPTILSALIILGASQTSLQHPQALWLWFCFAFINYTNTNIHKIWLGKNQTKFFNFALTAMIVRGIVGLSCFAGFLLAGTQNIRLFTFYFIFLYLLFLCFEIYNLVTNLQRDSKTY